MMELCQRFTTAQRAFITAPSGKRRTALIEAHAAFVCDFCPNEADALIAELASRIEAAHG